MPDNKLTYANQLEFKSWAKTQGLDSDWYYFDFITVVDAKDPCYCPDIPGILANGENTWAEALATIKRYFSLKKQRN